MSADLTSAELAAEAAPVRRAKPRKPAAVPWTLVLLGYRSGKEMLRLQHRSGALPELWLPSPLPDGPRQVKARRVQLDSANRVAYYVAGRLDLKSEVEARAASGGKKLPELRRERKQRHKPGLR